MRDAERIEWARKWYGPEYMTQRSRVIKERGMVCERCGTHTPFIQTHHLHYLSHGDLICLCARCHVIADSIRNLDLLTLERSATANWFLFRRWGDLALLRGWYVHLGEWTIMRVFYQEFLLTVVSEVTLAEVVSAHAFSQERVRGLFGLVIQARAKSQNEAQA